jgi:hypothetical protein
MKCCGSPTTSTGADPVIARPSAADALQAVLFDEILKPLAATLGPVGDIAIESVTQHLFLPARP